MTVCCTVPTKLCEITAKSGPALIIAALFTDPQQLAKIGMGNESVPIQLAQCWCRGLAISTAKV